MAKVITCPYSPAAELQSEDGIQLYAARLQELVRSDLCSELSNVMAAKHNLIMRPSGADQAIEKQVLVSELTDKAFIICCLEFGEAIFNFDDGDIVKINELINKVDSEVAQQDMDPDLHGDMMLRKLGVVIKSCSKTKPDAEDERLVNVVKKKNRTGNCFTDINNDLGTFINNNNDCDPLIKMAYGYARRIAMAGLCLQRIADREHYEHVYKVFKSLQLSTGQTIEFQREAGKQARELIYSYTDLFSEENLNTMVGMIEAGRIDFSRSPTEDYIDAESLADILKSYN